MTHMMDNNSPASDSVHPAREGLRKSLERVREQCTDCGACLEECAFLKRYGTPGEIARSYDPSSGQGMTIPFACSLCRLCSAVCPEGVEPAAMFLEMRREAVDRGNGIFPEHKGLLDYERTGMSGRFTYYGLPEGCTGVLFPGCAFPGTRPARTKEVFEMLREEDPSLGIVLDCCGRISQSLGRDDFSRAMMEEMQGYLVDHGVKDVIVVCPNCYDMFRQYAPKLSVRMVYEVMPETGAASERGEVVIHDPCGTRFHTVCHDAVRECLKQAGVAAHDMGYARERTLCCGSGAGADALSPDLARQWMERSAGEAKGRTVATYCAGCVQKMDSHSRSVHVLDILCAPEQALAGKSPVSRGAITYLNRLRLKAHFRKNLRVAAWRKRTFWAGEKPKGALGRILVLAGIIAAIIMARVTGLTDLIDQERLRGFIQGAGVMAPIIYMGLYAIAPSLLLPGLPFTIAGGILFGPFWGVVYAITGATAGACIAFLVARYAARGWVEGKLTSPRWKELDEGVERNGWKVVAFTRLIPLFPFNLLNYAFGLTKIGFIPYAVASFFCMLPACIAFIVFSSSLIDLLKGHVSANLLIGVALIVLVSLIPFAYRIYRKRHQGSEPV